MDDFKLPDIKNIEVKIPNMNDINRKIGQDMANMQKLKSLEKAEKTRREVETLETLKRIEANTVGLNEITDLLGSNLKKQDEVLGLLQEALTIGASKTKEEAEGKWRNIMKKTHQLTEDVETIQKVQGFANTVYQLFINNPFS